MSALTTTTFECVHCGQPCHIDEAFTDPLGRGDVCGGCIERLSPMTGGVFPVYVATETMRSHRINAHVDGQWVDKGPYYDMRGTPIGEQAQVWEFERLVAPRPGKRRVREHVKIMRCPEGWYSTSGGNDEPSGPALCATLLSGRWAGGFGGFDRSKYDAHHDLHPVVWVIKIRRGRRVTTANYCNPELPAEYRPDGWTDGEVAALGAPAHRHGRDYQ